jgi:hypothetical protein
VTLGNLNEVLQHLPSLKEQLMDCPSLPKLVHAAAAAPAGSYKHLQALQAYVGRARRAVAARLVLIACWKGFSSFCCQTWGQRSHARSLTHSYCPAHL